MSRSGALDDSEIQSEMNKMVSVGVGEQCRFQPAARSLPPLLSRFAS